MKGAKNLIFVFSNMYIWHFLLILSFEERRGSKGRAGRNFEQKAK